MRAKTYLLHVIFAVPLVATITAFAADDVAYPTVGDLSRVQGETIMFDAKAKRADAKAKMQESVARAGDDPAMLNTQSQSVVASELPTVTGISGAKGRLFATFRYPNNTTTVARSGEVIPGGFTVAEVSLDRAVLTKGDRRIPLQTGVAVAAPDQNSLSQPMLPGAPLMRPGRP